jgi:hypothetical protein
MAFEARNAFELKIFITPICYIDWLKKDDRLFLVNTNNA